MSERQLRAQFIQVGTHLLTPDGWQQVRGVLVHAEDEKSLDQVTVYTPQRDMDTSTGWEFRFDHLLRVRDDAPAEADCPRWCVEHYRGGSRLEQSNCASFPDSVPVVEACTGVGRELGLWAERRVDRETGEVEAFGIIEMRSTLEDVELPPERLRELARKLTELADLVEQTR
jgi:hypothetical protein